MPSSPAVRHVAEPAPDGEDLPSRQAASLTVVHVTTREMNLMASQCCVAVEEESVGAHAATEHGTAQVPHAGEPTSTSKHFWGTQERREVGGGQANALAAQVLPVPNSDAVDDCSHAEHR